MCNKWVYTFHSGDSIFSYSCCPSAVVVHILFKKRERFYSCLNDNVIKFTPLLVLDTKLKKGEPDHNMECHGKAFSCFVNLTLSLYAINVDCWQFCPFKIQPTMQSVQIVTGSEAKIKPHLLIRQRLVTNVSCLLNVYVFVYINN